MPVDNYLLGMSELARKAIESGEAYRQGGVIYSNAGRIIEHLHDVNVASNANSAVQSLLTVSVVPMAIFGVSMLAINHRLGKIEAKLDALKVQIEKVINELHLANFKADALLIGTLIGIVRSCQLDISEQREHRFENYRQSLIQSYHQLKTFVFAMARSKVKFKHHEEVLAQYTRAMFLAGIAARDVAFRMGESDSAIALSTELATDAQELKQLVFEIIESPSSLFWRKETHLDVAIDIRESSDRLSSHTAMLKVFPKEKLDSLLCSQLAE